MLRIFSFPFEEVVRRIAYEIFSIAPPSGEMGGWRRGGLKEMKNLGKKISAITGKELKLCGE